MSLTVLPCAAHTLPGTEEAVIGTRGYEGLPLPSNFGKFLGVI